MYVPPPFMEQLFAGDLTLREVYERVGGDICGYDQEEVCWPQLDCLNVACTRVTLLDTSVLVMDTPTTPVVDRNLYHHRGVMVYDDIDGIREGSTRSVKIATELVNLVGI